MDFYTGKPDRSIQHYGVICYSFQTSQATGFVKAITNFFSYSTALENQSDEEALYSIEQLVLSRQSNANVVYDMNVSMTHIPIQNGFCVVTKIYASYGIYID